MTSEAQQSAIIEEHIVSGQTSKWEGPHVELRQGSHSWCTMGIPARLSTGQADSRGTAAGRNCQLDKYEIGPQNTTPTRGTIDKPCPKDSRRDRLSNKIPGSCVSDPRLTRTTDYWVYLVAAAEAMDSAWILTSNKMN